MTNAARKTCWRTTGPLVVMLLGSWTAQAAEDVVFTAEHDGSQQRYVQVLPTNFASEKPVDVLIALHGHGSDRWQFIRQQRDECRAVRDFAKRHHMILIAPDYRAPTSWMGPAAEADTRQIISQLKESFRVRKIILCGASMGGASCLTFAALHPDAVDGVVSMNGTANHVEYANFQDAISKSFGGAKHATYQYRKRSAELWPHRLTMPIAFTVGGKDKSVPPDSVLRLAAQLERDGRPIHLIHRPSGGHATTYDDAVAALQFVFEQLGPASVHTKPKSSATPHLRLTLPPAIYAVAGKEIRLYFDNIVLTPHPESYRFDVRCDVGELGRRSWIALPTAEEVGSHSLTIVVSDGKGNRLDEASTTLHVTRLGRSARRDVALLIVGDSLTHATTYPNELGRLLSEPGNPRWRMLGTHRPRSAMQGVRHEGYGGWTWQRFVSKFEPNPDGTHRKRSSPFVFLNANGKPQLDVERYLETTAKGEELDVVFFLLGINDCFSADPDDLAAIDRRIDVMLHHAETLLLDFRRAAPHADLAVCVTTPPNARESGFQANYKGRYHRWGWKRIQHRLVERLSKHFHSAAVDDERYGRIHVVPTHLNLDPIDGYPENNGVHPNAHGYRQIATSLHSWLMWRLAK